MSTAEMELGATWRELDEGAMAQMSGGGPFAEFVYDTTHTLVTLFKYALTDGHCRNSGQLAAGA